GHDVHRRGPRLGPHLVDDLHHPGVVGVAVAELGLLVHPAQADGVAAVAVPVADHRLVRAAAEGHDGVGLAAAAGVPDVELDAAPHPERVAPVPVPVTDADAVVRAAVGDDAVGVTAADGVLQVV